MGRAIRITALFLIAALLLIVPEAGAFSRKPPGGQVVPGRVLVKFYEGTGPETIARIVKSEGGTVIRVFASTGVHLVALEKGISPADAVKGFASHDEVEYAEPVMRATPLEKK